MSRLHGSYEALWAGQVCEALVDLSGGVAERWSLRGTMESGEQEEQQQHQQEVGDEREERGDAPAPSRRKELKLPKAVREACTISCSLHNHTGGERQKEGERKSVLNKL